MYDGAPVLRRRALLGLTAALALPGCGARGDIESVRLGSGRAGGLFHEFAHLLADAAARDSTVRIEPIVTDGSLANIDLLARGEIDAALSLADTVAATGTRARAIGRLYETYIQLAVTADSPIRRVGELRGARIDLGVRGSGGSSTAERMLRAAGLDPAHDVVSGNHELSDAVALLHTGAVDAIVWGGGIPTPGPDIPARARLIDLGEMVPALRQRFGYDYDRVTIPADAYPGSPGLATIGVPNLLLAGPGLPDATVASITRLLVHSADGLMPVQALGFHFLNRRWLVGTGSVPLHPAAAAQYRDEHG
ncbi:TAXI family TRAP transporter solute-binding subunit [Nocardia wallacei]|uniref:TAXI family TRAP transporter solute-binding subunit n=1 Tax=Nocardia wallacei TaxID=480035 RepID=UPI0024540BEC|nr:TAXI family TRAP transporter solute-binding subunit [Nocardia wallacei]